MKKQIRLKNRSGGGVPKGTEQAAKWQAKAADQDDSAARDRAREHHPPYDGSNHLHAFQDRNPSLDQLAAATRLPREGESACNSLSSLPVYSRWDFRFSVLAVLLALAGARWANWNSHP